MEQLEYRRLIKVLEQVAGARDGELYPVLAEAVAVHLGWIDAFVAENPAYLALGSDGEEQYLTRFRPDFVEEYAERWRLNNPFASHDGVVCLTRRGVATLGQLRLRATGPERDFADTFLRRHGIDDMLKIVVRSPATGAVSTLGVPFDGDRRAIEPGDLLMAATLGPLLSPYFDANPVPAFVRDLTSAERDVAELAVLGLDHRHIARRLNVGEGTVEERLTRVLEKTGCGSLTELTAQWRRRPTG
ncbi:LuxR C-terminal-related transcriptional regulator [Nonomuraea angiospora]|uniref:helix-turn-helix transcriptional regulator n=1 Tax=Nonomuraea angiospora TaxID=46172 RepID=UPI0029A0106D|nr:helix-turn-helix transcriptional regulator [Nonomuraea angiospora]MDX3101154.1 helix-turn-helix transcriptional regulator [Nonomuraea angiospora]